MSNSDNYRILVHVAYPSTAKAWKLFFKALNDRTSIGIDDTLEALLLNAEFKKCDAIIINPCVTDCASQFASEQKIKDFLEKGTYKSRGNPDIYIVQPCEVQGFVTEYPKDVNITHELSLAKILEEVKQNLAKKQNAPAIG